MFLQIVDCDLSELQCIDAIQLLRDRLKQAVAPPIILHNITPTVIAEHGRHVHLKQDNKTVSS